MTLNDLKITISLEEYFSLSYYRHLSNTVVVSEERYNIISNQEGFKELIYCDSYVGESGKTLYRLQRMENIVKSSIEKDREREKENEIVAIAKAKHTIIEEWKKASLFRLMKTGQLNKEQALDFIKRAMNPVNERDKKFAEKLNYPYREENIISNPEGEQKQNQTNNVKVSESSLTYGKTSAEGRTAETA